MGFMEKDITESKYREQTVGEEQPTATTALSHKEHYLSEDYEGYFVEYVGNIAETIGKLDYASVFLPGRFYAVVFVKRGMLQKLLQDVPEITNVQSNFPYTLSELQITNEPHDPNFNNKGNVNLQGNDVVVGIISTGIDYMNARFMSGQGKTRIEAIWDQSIQEGTPPQGFVQGVEFTREEIDRAIKDKSLMGNPYDIVPHKDEIGHGTALAGIIGGSKLEAEEDFQSIAPSCTFAVVKLNEAKNITKELVGIEDVDIPVYQAIDLTAAIRYLAELQLKLRKPMVIYLPLGTNQGAHDGSTVAERYIDLFSKRRDLIFIANSGNQGNSSIHASGNLFINDNSNIVRLRVARDENELFLSLYTLKADKISFVIKSPTGEFSPVISIPQENEFLSFFVGETQVRIRFFANNVGFGEAATEILFSNITEGVWEFDLSGDFLATGRYDLWLEQKEFLKEDTGFLSPDRYITIMPPATSINIIATAGYNQQTNTILPQSGRGFTRDGRNQPSITAPAVRALTIGLNNTLVTVNGMAVAGAYLTGAAALLLQWGIVNKNMVDLSPQKPKNIFVGTAVRKEEISYPDQEWGYGVVSIENMFNLIGNFSRNEDHITQGLEKKITRSNKEESDLVRNKTLGVKERVFYGLYINIPEEILRRLGR